MNVQVKLFATLTRYCAGSTAGIPFDLELPDSATLLDLLHRLEIPVEETKITFVNGIIQSTDWVLKPGDQVGIFPAIAGG